MSEPGPPAPSSLVARIAEAKAKRDWSVLGSVIPYTQLLGISADHSNDELRGVMRFSPSLIGNAAIPALHGGTIGALLESTAIFQLLWESETIVLPRTITITVDYLRSGRAVDTFARGTITRLGRRVASVRVEAWQEDRSRPIATANAHLLITPSSE